MEYNAEATGDKYKYIAQAMGVKDTENMTQAQYRKSAIDAVRQLSKDVNIPATLTAVGVLEKDIDFLSESAYADACRPGNPKETCVEDIKALYKSML
jgi:lactaldehyde reductase